MKVQSGEVPQVTRGIGPMRLLVDKWRSLRDLNNPISWGIEPDSLFVLRYKKVKFLKFPMDGGIGPVRLLNAKSRLLSDVNNPISWGMEPESSFPKRYKVVKFLKLLMEGGIGPLKLLEANARKLRDVRNQSWGDITPGNDWNQSEDLWLVWKDYQCWMEWFYKGSCYKD